MAETFEGIRLEGLLLEAVEAYTALEREIDAAWAPLVGRVCPTCPTPCCRVECGQEAVECAWLRLISTRDRGDWIGKDWADRTPCAAMGPEGCTLAVGRPAVCRGYYCQPLLDACEDEHEVVFYTFVAELPRFVATLGRRRYLLHLEADELADSAERILQRVQLARKWLEVSRVLIDPQATAGQRDRTALTLACADTGWLKKQTRDEVLRRRGLTDGARLGQK